MIFADIYVSFQCLILVFVNRWRSWPMQWWTRCRMVRRHWYKYKSTQIHMHTNTQIHKYKEKRTSPIQYSHHRDNILARRTKIGFDKSSVCSPVTHSYKQESDEDGKTIFLAGLILPPSALSQNFLFPVLYGRFWNWWNLLISNFRFK